MNGNSTIWTDEMISFLKANFFKLTNAQLAKGCGTTVGTVIVNTIKVEIDFVRTQLLAANKTKGLPPAGKNEQVLLCSCGIGSTTVE